MLTLRRLATAVLALAAPLVVAQDIGPVFDMGTMTTTMAQGAIVKSERERSIRLGQGDPLAGGSGGGSRARRRARANPAVVLYRPDLAARKRNFEAFVSRLAATDSKAAGQLRGLNAKGDLIVQATPLMRGLHLSPNSVADAMAMYLVVAWHGARGEDKANPAEYRAVSAQLSRYMAASPGMARVGNAVKQQAAEAMILGALLVDAAVTDGKKNPGRMPEVRAGAADGARQAFGFDVTRYRLGASGFR